MFIYIFFSIQNVVVLGFSNAQNDTSLLGFDFFLIIIIMIYIYISG